MVLARLVARRLLLAVPLLWAVMTITFLLLRMAPGDPAVTILGDRATPEQYAELREELGLDRPLINQYGSFMSQLLQGDVGASLVSNRPATDVIAARLPVTLSLALGATLASVALGVAFGVFAVTLGWLPPNGFVPFEESPADWARTLVLPVAALGVSGMATVARMTRGSMTEVLDRDFVRTLRANGVPRRSVVYKHALRNAAIPVTTMVGLQFIGMLSSAVVIEQVFVLRGVGTLARQAASEADFPVMQALVLYLTLVVVAVNLLVDVLYGWLDPRVRRS